MDKNDLKFLSALVDAPSPSGFEQPAATVFRKRIAKVADNVETNVMGSVHAILKGTNNGISLMLSAHIDEIGLMVNYIDDRGFIFFSVIGGVDTSILPGMRISIYTFKGALRGVIGYNNYLENDSNKRNQSTIDLLFIDLGLSKEQVTLLVRIGDPITFSVGLEIFGDNLAVSRAFDDKIGVWIAARVLEEVKKAGGSNGDLIVAATVQEEIGMRGGATSAYGVDPNIGIAIDVGHATDYPDTNKRKHGEVACGSGPIIARGPNINPVLFNLLISAAKNANIPFQLTAEPRGTGTDANAIQLSRGGKAAALVLIPLRYMHTPIEVVSLKDLDYAVKLLTRFILDLEPDTDFTPH